MDVMQTSASECKGATCADEYPLMHEPEKEEALPSFDNQESQKKRLKHRVPAPAASTCMYASSRAISGIAT